MNFMILYANSNFDCIIVGLENKKCAWIFSKSPEVNLHTIRKMITKLEKNNLDVKQMVIHVHIKQ